MFEWYHWFFYVVLSIGTLVRLAKSNGWRPKVTNESNAFWAASAILFPAFWVFVFYQAGFWG